MLSLRTVKSIHHLTKGNGVMNCRKLLSTMGENVEQTWSMFPEYKKAAEDLEQGDFVKAIPALERIYDVLESAMGKTSPAATKMLFKLANSQRYAGQFEKSISTLNKLNKSTVQDQIHSKQLVSFNLIQQKKFSDAFAVASEAVELSEKQNPADCDISLLSSSYTMKGISSLLIGDLQEAEIFLGLAGRSAQTPLEEMATLCNLAALGWFRLSSTENTSSPGKPIFNLWDYNLQQMLSNEKVVGNENDVIAPEIQQLMDSPEGKRLLTDTLQIWLDVIEDSKKKQQGGGGGGAGLCGPVGTSSTINMTGMADQDVKSVTSSAAAAAATTTTTTTTTTAAATEEKLRLDQVDTTTTFEEEEDFEEKLLELPFTCVYANSLCTLAEMHAINGNHETSSEYLSTAFKALNLHDYDIRCHGVMGRVLALIGREYMRESQAVKAEGLYRSALQKLRSPYAVHDLRYQYESAMVEGTYGRLLTKWEKREAVGNEYRAKAKAQIEALTIRPSIDHSSLQQYVFSGMFVFPVE